jgi:CheY-like chemotaxis protein
VTETVASGERVLVVDDEPDIVALVAYHLAKSGYSVSTATNGPEGLAVARRDKPSAPTVLSGLPRQSESLSGGCTYCSAVTNPLRPAYPSMT